MGQIFQLAKDFVSASLEDIEALLDSPSHPRRVAAASSDFQARRQATPDGGRRALYELYLRRHDRIDTWILSTVRHHMSLAATCGKSREPLYLLAGPELVRAADLDRQHLVLHPPRRPGCIPDRSDSRERPPRPGAEGGRWLDPRSRQAR